MFKKYTAILFITLAYAVLLGHNIFPHHHHDTDHDLPQQHQNNHQHDNDQEIEDLNNFFCHFNHSADDITFHNHNIISTISNPQFSFVAMLFDNFSSDEFLLPPLLNKSHSKHFIYIAPHSLSLGLRAPPSFIA